MPKTLTRRELLAAGGAAGLTLSPMLRSIVAAEKKPRFRISSCDWSLGKAANIEAFEVAKQIGLDGVEVSFGAPGGKFDLRKEEVRKQYEEAAKENGQKISSLAMGVLNRVPYASSPDAEKWVDECVEVMAAMGQNRVLLAFFGRGNIQGNKGLQDKVIARLKKVAPKAEKAGVSLGIESMMNAKEHIRILDAVGSPAVTVYYDVCNMHYRGYDIYKEIRQLGKRICQFHMKEKKVLLGKGKIDFPKVKEAIDAIGYKGWLVIESARPGGMSLQEAYTANRKYLRSIFPTEKT